MSADVNLRFAVLALQARLLNPSHFVEACTLWASRPETPLADLLVERGWLSPEGRVCIHALLDGQLGEPARADPPTPADCSPDSTTVHVQESRGRFRLEHLHAR